MDPNACKKLRAEVLDFMEADLDRGSCDTHEFGAMSVPEAPPPRLSTVSMDSSIGEPTPLALREKRITLIPHKSISGLARIEAHVFSSLRQRDCVLK